MIDLRATEAKLNQKFVLTGSDICHLANISANGYIQIGSSILENPMVKKLLEGKEHRE